MKVIIKGEAKEIAALVVALQERHEGKQAKVTDERESLIRQYKRRLAKLKSGASPADVVL